MFTFTRWYTHIIYTCNLHVYDTYKYSIHQLYCIRMCIPLFAPNTSGRDLSFWMISISPPHAALTDVGMGVHETQIGHSHFQARLMVGNLGWSLFEMSGCKETFKSSWTCVLGGLNSHVFPGLGDSHQPNSRGLYTRYEDFLLKVGWSFRKPRAFWPVLP